MPEHKIGKQMLEDVYGAIAADLDGLTVEDLPEALKLKEGGGIKPLELTEFARSRFYKSLGGESTMLPVAILTGDFENVFVSAMSMGIELGVAAEKRRAMEAMVDG